MFRLGVTSKDTTKTMNMCDRGSLVSPCHKSEINVISNINYQSKPGGCANTNQGLGSFISSIMAATFPSSSFQSPFTAFHFSKPKGRSKIKPFFWETFPKSVYPPTHPRVFVRFGKTKGEIWVEKGDFRGNLGGF